MQKQIDDRDGLVSFLDSCTLGEHSPNMLRVGLTVDKLRGALPVEEVIASSAPCRAYS